MKATQRDFASVAAKAAGQVRIFYFCGPDEAGAAAAATNLVASFPDPGERVELTGGDLRNDPVRLGDEARSSSLFGSSRHIIVRAAGDEAFDALRVFASVIDAGEAGGAFPVLVLATGATDKSRTAKLLLDRRDAVVAMFYAPDVPRLAQEVRRMADAAGLKLAGDLAERIARSSGLDVRLAQAEVTKLALYLDATPQAPRMADAEALEAIGASTEEDGFMPLVNAVLSGDAEQLPDQLRRLRELSLNPVGVALALERRAVQLAQLTARLKPGRSIESVIEAEQAARRVFSRDRRDLMQQMHCWTGRKLDRLVRRLAALHRALLSDSHSADLLLAHELGEIARRADPRRRPGGVPS